MAASGSTAAGFWVEDSSSLKSQGNRKQRVNLKFSWAIKPQGSLQWPTSLSQPPLSKGYTTQVREPIAEHLTSEPQYQRSVLPDHRLVQQGVENEKQTLPTICFAGKYTGILKIMAESPGDLGQIWDRSLSLLRDVGVTVFLSSLSFILLSRLPLC